MKTQQKIKTLNQPEEEIIKLPYNIEAEQYILGAVMNNNEALTKIISFITPEDFFEPLHQKLYQTILEYYQKDMLANPVTLKTVFEEEPAMIEAGGANYLLRLCSLASGVMNMRDYGLILQELKEKRQLIGIFQDKLTKIRSYECKKLIEELQGDIAGMHSNTSEYRLLSYESILGDLAQDLKVNPHGKICPTGIPRIDISMNGGMEGGKTYCVAAPPKYGKTMMKGTIANNLRKAGVNFLFVAAEMSPQQLTKRMIGADLDMKVRSMNNDNEEYVRYLAVNSMKKFNNMFFLNSPRIPIKALVTSIINAKRVKNIEGVIIDYLQLIGGKPRGMSLVEHQDEVAYTIAEVCKKEDIWGLYSCQLNRKGEVRNGDGILQAVEWIYELERFKLMGKDTETTFAYLKHVGTREFEELNIGSEKNPLFSLSPNGTHFITLE